MVLATSPLPPPPLPSLRKCLWERASGRVPTLLYYMEKRGETCRVLVAMYTMVKTERAIDPVSLCGSLSLSGF